MALGNLAIREGSSKDKSDNSYDDVPYESFSYAQTHPERLYTVAKLFGHEAPDFRKAKVLELGCAAGGNLLPLAVMYPDGDYTGIDLSHEQIELAIQQKNALGLSNIRFECMDIMDVTKDFGEYDYIIVHGILSWVPDHVGEKIMDICRDNLSGNGLAVVSYNTLPGWNFIKSLREMMLYHCGRFEDTAGKISQARLFLDFLSENTQGNASYKQVIDSERELLAKANDTYLFHDHLESHNRQFYLHEIAAMLQNRGHQYVADSAFATMFVGNMPAGAMKKLREVNDIVRQEQYMDFITNRRFRTTILCRKGQEINRSLKQEQIFDFYISSAIAPKEANAQLSDRMSFMAGDGKQEFQTHSRPASALFLEISNTRDRFLMKDMIETVHGKHGVSMAEIKKAALDSGLRLVMAGILDVHPDKVHCVRTVSKKPKAFAVARHQAMKDSAATLTNAAGESVQSDTLNNYIIRYLDGRTDIEELTEKLTGHALNGDIQVRRKDRPVTDEKKLKEILKPGTENRLGNLAAAALLVK